MNDFLQSLRNGQADKPRTPKTRKNFDNPYHYTSGPRFQSYGSGGGGGYQSNRNHHMKRPQAPQQGNQMPVDEGLNTSMLAEAMDTLGVHIETLAKNQEYLVNAQERTADMLERQAIAIERILNHLNIAPAPENSPEAPLKDQAPVKEDVSEKAFEHHYVTTQKTAPKKEISKSVKKPVKEPIKKIAKPSKQVIRRRKKIVSSPTPQKTTATSDNKLLSRDQVMDIIDTMRADGATFDQVASRLVELGQPTFSGRGEWHAQTIHRLCNKK